MYAHSVLAYWSLYAVLLCFHSDTLAVHNYLPHEQT